MKNYILFALISFAFFSCKEDEIDTYSATLPDGVSGIYFQYMDSYVPNATGQITERRFVDSISRSFINYPKETELKIGLPVKMMGYPTAYDRKVTFKVNKELTNCTEGVEFKVDYDNVVIAANQVQTTIPVIVFRTPLLQQRECRIAIDLVENDDFKLLMERYNNNTTANNSKIQYESKTFKLIISNIVQANNIGSYFSPAYFGEWTIEKFNLINSITGWTLENWQRAGSSTPSPVSMITLPFAAIQTRNYLQTMADAGTPIKEIDNSYMQLGPSYLVDYSKYEKE